MGAGFENGKGKALPYAIIWILYVGVGVLDDPNEFRTDRGAVGDARPYEITQSECKTSQFG